MTSSVPVMFTDLQGFTAATESMPPEQVLPWLSSYFDAMSSTIHLHHGTIDKYIGDAIMALWNAPLDDEYHVANACRAMLACREVAIMSSGDTALKTRMGLHTGTAVVGNVGASGRHVITAFNARPVQVSSRDELAMLSAGAIDGQMSPSAVILASNFDMAQHHATLLDALYSPYVWIFNSAKLKALSAADAQAVREAASAALKKGRILVDTMDQSERGRLGLAKRMQVRTLSARQRQAFRQTMQPPVEEAIIQALGDDAAWMEKFKAALSSVR